MLSTGAGPHGHCVLVWAGRVVGVLDIGQRKPVRAHFSFRVLSPAKPTVFSWEALRRGEAQRTPTLLVVSQTDSGSQDSIPVGCGSRWNASLLFLVRIPFCFLLPPRRWERKPSRRCLCSVTCVALRDSYVYFPGLNWAAWQTKPREGGRALLRLAEMTLFSLGTRELRPPTPVVWGFYFFSLLLFVFIKKIGLL